MLPIDIQKPDTRKVSDIPEVGVPSTSFPAVLQRNRQHRPTVRNELGDSFLPRSQMQFPIN
jgi:hypothetical protein